MEQKKSIFFPTGKKAMEIWFLVILILLLIFLVTILVLYGGLGDQLEKLLNKFGDLL